MTIKIHVISSINRFLLTVTVHWSQTQQKKNIYQQLFENLYFSILSVWKQIVNQCWINYPNILRLLYNIDYKNKPAVLRGYSITHSKVKAHSLKCRGAIKTSSKYLRRNMKVSRENKRVHKFISNWKFKQMNSQLVLSRDYSAPWTVRPDAHVAFKI